MDVASQFDKSNARYTGDGGLLSSIAENWISHMSSFNKCKFVQISRFSISEIEDFAKSFIKDGYNLILYNREELRPTASN